MKGQSAIEYLMTYGWMLISVAIVSGAVYSMTGNECADHISGFEATSIGLNEFGLNIDDELNLILENRESNTIQINEISVEEGEDSRSLSYENEFIGPGGSELFKVLGFQTSDSCNTLDINMVYDIGPIEGQQVTGSVTSNIEMVDGETPNSVTDLEVESEN